MSEKKNIDIIDGVSLSLAGLISMFNLLAGQDYEDEYNLSSFAWYIKVELEKLRNSVNSIKL